MSTVTLTDEELRPKIVIDVPMPVSYITKELVEQISLLEPLEKGIQNRSLRRKSQSA